jgi:predicted ArsR family transcriptional regulator
MSSRHRTLSDPRTLRALSHPVRLALLELLATDGPLTATEAAERLGESAANCSFHLRMLARYGYVEEAEGGRGRQRPWRTVDTVNQIRSDELDAEGQFAMRVLAGVLRQREFERLRAWDASRQDYPAAWREAAGETHTVVYLTVDELAELERGLSELATRHADRSDPRRRPPGSLPVAVFTHAFPLRRPDGATGDPDGDAGDH